MSDAQTLQFRRFPQPAAVLELLKPVTWFPPMWAYLCGVVSSGAALGERWPELLLGAALAGPVVCGMSQAANDWCDRHVDAINEPRRPIPSGRVPPRWALGLALAMSALALALGGLLGPWGFLGVALAVAGAWAYSLEPVRLKRSGLWGPGLVGLCYEGLPWFTGAAVMAAAAPDGRVVAIAALYALGAHGIMTINDFKAIEGDRALGIRSLPVVLGPARAARVLCAVMAAPQLVVVALLLAWGLAWSAAAVALALAAQAFAMRRMLGDPRGRAPWFNGAGVGPYVLGMMAAALGLGAG
ncbi:MAG: chlorophyll synthase ChlG [Albimonas sp.]|uniref:chlorophyll synthase ChlG n=1 Tax=Albimonas sp. TaxID=1872425 RepID=UPI004057498C|tara:strand:+ start:77 stop:973 length:897 start_codon:yes stop_codon:yes gene_type:complete